LKNEFQVERNDPILQIKQARHIVIADIRSVSTGAEYAMTEARSPTKLKIIKSIMTFGVGNIALVMR
jgi:hypothetical protein